MMECNDTVTDTCKKNKRKHKHKTKHLHNEELRPSAQPEKEDISEGQQTDLPLIADVNKSKSSRKKPRSQEIADQPGRPIATDQPGRPIATDQPGRPIATDQPGHPIATDQPGHPIATDQPGHPIATDQPGHPIATDQPGRPIATDGEGDLRLGCAVSMVRKNLPLDIIHHWEQVEDSYTNIHDSWRFGSVTGQWKKGRWTHEEVETLKQNVMAYMHNNGVEDVSELMFDRPRKDRGKFFQLISKNINRPLFHVYRKMLRIFDEANYAGKWSGEQDKLLLRLHEIHGTKWALIGKTMGLAGAACRDRYRRMTRRNTGPWTAAEEERLIDVMKEVCVNNGHVPESGEEEDRVLPATVSWHDIARSVRSRTAMQCRQKWVMSLSWKSKDSSQMWSVDDTIRLLEALGSMADVVSEDEVDWAGLSQKWSVHWTHYYLRERWGRLRRDVPNYRVKSFQDALDYLITYKLPALQEQRNKTSV